MSAADRSPVIVAARRTAIATAGRAFAAHTVDELAAPVLAAVAAEVASSGLAVDDVVLGNCMGLGGDTARVAALRAGLGIEVPGVTVDLDSGSGLDAVMQAASRVRAGDAALVIAGGAESASTAPHRLRPDTGERYARTLRAQWRRRPRHGPRRRAPRARARHHSRAPGRPGRALARARPRPRRPRVFDAEIVPVDGIARDDRPRASMDVARLARFAPAFAPASASLARDCARAGGTVTAGNSCGFSDGAAAMAVTTAAVARGLGLPALRVRAAAVAGGDPALPGLGAAPAVMPRSPAPACPSAILGFVEITEAFMAQLLAVSDDLADEETVRRRRRDRARPPVGRVRRDPARALGGADARGLRPRRGRPRRLLAACSIGGGQGIAMIVERVA